MKRRFWLFFLVSLTILVISLTSTYALLETNGHAEVTEDVGKWIIKLNGTDISQGIASDFTINDFVYTSNANVADNVIAPGRNGYFDITVDPTGTNVAVRYDITISLTAGTYPDNIAFNIEDLTNGNAVKTSADTYSGVISLDDIKNSKTITIRVNIVWTDNENYDTTDSTLGTNKDSKISVPVTVNVKQYLGETITPYA
jgi:hypothetical protein